MRALPVLRMMDKCTCGMDMWTTLQVDHMPTPPEHLPTWIPPYGPDALRLPLRRPCLAFFKKVAQTPEKGPS